MSVALHPHLTVVALRADDRISFEPPPFSLRRQPQRPGELTELVEVSIEPAEAARVRAEAAAAHLPVELALYIAIEAERAVDDAVEVVGIGRTELVEFLGAAVADVPLRGPRHLYVRPYEEYAAAVVRGLDQAEVGNGLLTARVPRRVAAAWAHTAAAAGVPLERWLKDIIARANSDRGPWEAAAARVGRTLAEWVLLHAARCARSSSTSPQTAASS